MRSRISVVLSFLLLFNLISFLFYSSEASAAVGSWTIKSTISTYADFAPHGSEAVALPDGNIFIAGGESYYYPYISNRSWLYNPSTDTFTPKADMPYQSEHHTMTLLNDGRVMVMNNDGMNETSSARRYHYFIYDPALNTWSFRDPKSGSTQTYLNFPYTFHMRDAAASTLHDGRAMFTGGWDSIRDERIKKVVFYNPTTGVWSTGPDMPVTKEGHWQVTLKDGRVAVGGGTDGGEGSYIYSPSSNSWSPISVTLPGGDATLLADGRVLIVWSTGYYYGQVRETGGVIWDPSTNTTTEIVRVPEFLAGVQVNATKDGKAIITHGSTASYNGVGHWMGARIFDSNTTPNPPINTSYFGNQTIIDNRPTFTWKFSDPDPGDSQGKYQVVGSRDNWGSWHYNSGEKVTNMNVHQTTALADGTWNFAIRTADQKGKWSEWTFISNITIGLEALKPVNVSIPQYLNGLFYLDLTGVEDLSGIEKITVSARHQGTWTWVDHPVSNVGGGTWRAIIDPAKHGNSEGLYDITILMTDKLGNVNDYYVQYPIQVTVDLTPPTYTGTTTIPSIVNQAAGSYKIRITGISDNLSGVESVRFPTWTEANGQDDLKWHVGTDLGGGTWEVTIPLSEHNNETGKYITHIYARDRAGNQVIVASGSTIVLEPYDATIISHTIPSTLNPGQTVAVSVTVKNTGGSTWSEADGVSLGAVGDSDPLTTVTRQGLPAGVTIAPGQTHTFTFNLTAPKTLGNYTTDWRMLKEFVKWFGETAVQTVEVSNTPPVLTLTSPNPIIASDGAPLNRFEVTGMVNDPDNDTLTVRVEVSGVEKSVLVSNTATDQPFSLSFDVITDEISGGDHPITVTVDDGKGGVVIDQSLTLSVKQRLYNGAFILVNAPIESYPSRIYSDPESDPKYQEQYKYAHEPSYFEMDMGFILNHNDWITLSSPTDMPYESFPKVGKYDLSYRAQDNPKDDSRFDEFKLWSDESPNFVRFYVHRKPIADFTISVTPNGGNYNVGLTSTSYDLDHISTANKGIMATEWKYRKKGDMDWISGQPSGSLPPNVEYEVGLRVRDIDGPNGIGVWSDVTIKTFKTMGSPTPGFTVTPKEGYRGTTFAVRSTATDPTDTPDQLTYVYTITHVNGEPLPSNTKTDIHWTGKDFNLVFQALQKMGQPKDIYTIKQVITNTNGVSASYSDTISVINRKPTATNLKITDNSGAKTLSSSSSTPTFVDKMNPILSWTYGDADADSQHYFRVNIYDISNNLIQSTGAKASAGTSWTPSSLADGMYSSTVEVHDGYEWGNISKGYFSILTNRAPVADFRIDPTLLFEGDTARITSLSTDPDGDPLTHYYVVTKPDGSTSSYTVKNPSFTVTNGIYRVKLTVTDPYGATDSIEKTFTVGPLQLEGFVQHTPEWEQNRLKWNAAQDPDRAPDVFFAGEKFILKALTTDTQTSTTVADQVTVKFVEKNLSTTLSSTDRINWSGEMWREDFEELPDGTYHFIFTSTWSNGVTKTDTVQIKIIGSVYDFYELHRRF